MGEGVPPLQCSVFILSQCQVLANDFSVFLELITFLIYAVNMNCVHLKCKTFSSWGKPLLFVISILWKLIC